MRSWLRSTESGKLLSNSAIIFSLRIGAAACVYLSFVLLARFMQAELLGHFVLVQAGLWLGSSLATLGLADGANRFIPAALASGDTARISAYIAWSRKVVLASSVLLGLVASALIILLDGDFSSPYSSLVLIAAASLPFASLNNLNSQIARSLDWVFFASLTNTFLRPFLLLTTIVVVYWLMRITPSAELVLQAQLALLIGLLIAQSTLLRKRFKAFGLPPATAPFKTTAWLGTSMVLLISELYFAFYIDIHVLFAGLFLEARDLAILNAALRTISIMAFASAAVGIAFRPRIAQLFERGNPEKLRMAARWALGISVLPVLAFVLVLMPSAEFILGLFGPEYVVGKTALIVAAFAQVSIAVATPLLPMLGMTGYHKELFWISLLTVLLIIICHVLLTTAFGIVGSAATLLISSTAWTLALYIRVAKNLGIHLLRSNRSTI